MTVVPVTSADLDSSEVSWFSALCSDDYAFLGVPDGALRSSFTHCRDIVLEAEKQGFRNILAPSSYQVGQDTLSFVAGMAPLTSKINFLAAIRCGEMQPIMLARTVATLDHMLEGRLTLNIISSDFPGEVADSGYRYRRSREVVEILRQAWTQDEINYEGEIYQFKGLTADPARPYQQNGGPLLYFGGYSPPALDLCGFACDVYLMWPEPKEQLAQRMKDVHARAAEYGRTLDYGLRVHMIVRDTEAEAREYAEHLVSKLDDEYGSRQAWCLALIPLAAMGGRSASAGVVGGAVASFLSTTVTVKVALVSFVALLSVAGWFLFDSATADRDQHTVAQSAADQASQPGERSKRLASCARRSGGP